MKKKWISLLCAATMVFGSGSLPMGLSKVFADNDPSIRFLVEEKEGSSSYLDGATYDVYLKYLVGEDGKLHQATDGELLPKEKNKKGHLLDEEDMEKMGTITLNGEETVFSINSSKDHLKGKLNSAIYTIIPVNRAPGYFYDLREDGDFDEIVFSNENKKDYKVRIPEEAIGEKRDKLAIQKGEDHKGHDFFGESNYYETISREKPTSLNENGVPISFEKDPDFKTPIKHYSIGHGRYIDSGENRLKEGRYLMKLPDGENGIYFSYYPNKKNKMICSFENEENSIFVQSKDSFGKRLRVTEIYYSNRNILL